MAFHQLCAAAPGNRARVSIRVIVLQTATYDEFREMNSYCTPGDAVVEDEPEEHRTAPGQLKKAGLIGRCF